MHKSSYGVGGDRYFLQLLCSAIGTSTVCIWTTTYFAVGEMGSIIPKFGNKILLFMRFIDDLVGMWIDNPQELSWEVFKREITYQFWKTRLQLWRPCRMCKGTLKNSNDRN